MQFTIGKKIGLGFGVVITLMAISASVGYLKLNQMMSVEHRIIKLRYPTVRAADQMMDGMNHSLAALRGYMILGSDPAKAEFFMKDRQNAWTSIDTASQIMHEFSKNWTDPANIERLENLTISLEQFRTAQLEVESISQSEENIPAYKLLLDEAAPRAGAMLAAITVIINEEGSLGATPERKNLLNILADTRGSFAVGLANIRAYLLSGDEKFRSNFEAKWTVNEEVYEKALNNLELFTPTQREQWDIYAEKRTAFAPLPAQMFELRSAEDWNIANHWLGTKAAPRAREIKSILGEMLTSQENLVAKDQVTLASAGQTLTYTMILSTLIAAIIGSTIAIFLSRRISVSLIRVVKRAEDIADGDLTGEDLDNHSNDEIGSLTTAVNAMSKSLREIITNLNLASSEVASAATEIAASSEEMSTGMGEQAGQMNQVSAAMEEMNSSVTEVARKSGEASSQASQAGNDATEGGEVVANTVAQIEGIAQQVNESAESVAALGAKSQEIGRIIEVINDIADQTNLLALNAAIEAARAGEHGRGFAVVADEVRKLAERTQQATEEVGSSIKEIQTETQRAVERMEAGQEKVKVGVELAQQAGESLKRIVVGSEKVASEIGDIAAAAEEQSATANEVSRNLENISAVVRQSTEGASQAAAAASQLSSNAERLQAIVGRFRLSETNG